MENFIYSAALALESKLINSSSTNDKKSRTSMYNMSLKFFSEYFIAVIVLKNLFT